MGTGQAASPSKEERARFLHLWMEVFGTKSRPWGARRKIEQDLDWRVPEKVWVNALGRMKAHRIGPNFPYLKSTVSGMLSDARFSEQEFAAAKERRRGTLVNVGYAGKITSTLLSSSRTEEEKIRMVMGTLLEQFGQTRVRGVLKKMSDERRKENGE